MQYGCRTAKRACLHLYPPANRTSLHFSRHFVASLSQAPGAARKWLAGIPARSKGTGANMPRISTKFRSCNPGIGFNIGHFQRLSPGQSSFRAERFITHVSIKQLDSVFSGIFLNAKCSVDPESRWPNLEPSPATRPPRYSTIPNQAPIWFTRDNKRQIFLLQNE